MASRYFQEDMILLISSLFITNAFIFYCDQSKMQQISETDFLLGFKPTLFKTVYVITIPQQQVYLKCAY